MIGLVLDGLEAVVVGPVLLVLDRLDGRRSSPRHAEPTTRSQRADQASRNLFDDGCQPSVHTRAFG